MAAYTNPGRGVVVRVDLVGGAYRRGVYRPGWADAYLETGERVFVGAQGSNGFKAVVCNLRSRGYDCDEYERRLAEWVRTGQLPPRGIAV